MHKVFKNVIPANLDGEKETKKHSRIETEGKKQGIAPPPRWKRSQMAIHEWGER